MGFDEGLVVAGGLSFAAGGCGGLPSPRQETGTNISNQAVTPGSSGGEIEPDRGWPAGARG